MAEPTPLRRRHSAELQNSISEGLDDMKGGKVHPHSEARKLYKKWLRE